MLLTKDQSINCFVVPIPKKPSSEDLAEIQEWKWSWRKLLVLIFEALRSSSPHTVVSHLPIHQDGSCNGLQHYAALGRDSMEAAAVNLTAGDKPADVYSEIAVSFQVDRKLVKQTVMTSVYGVTSVGAREQIKRRLEEKGLITDDRLLFPAACYAAKVTLAALGEIFEAASGIMGWLGDCAKVDFSKQRTAFPPNFVHSFDSTHMMMTAVACRDSGLRFAGLSHYSVFD
ncbi:hypothetical protein SO802_000515 [Lithocarpus litseifolius]|uniref:DNA-directed RNA polymerase n=1 Tax=Lithocarpus litseifolius TaxID=425828 RepID=A0AAW2DXI8_9ROSI